MSNIDTRELDAYIAENIYGWVYEHIGPDGSGENECDVLVRTAGYIERKCAMGFALPPKGKVHRAYFCPHYTSDLRDAILLANKVGLHFKHDIPTDPLAISQLAIAKWQEGPERGEA